MAEKNNTNASGLAQSGVVQNGSAKSDSSQSGVIRNSVSQAGTSAKSDAQKSRSLWDGDTAEFKKIDSQMISNDLKDRQPEVVPTKKPNEPGKSPDDPDPAPYDPTPEPTYVQTQADVNGASEDDMPLNSNFNM